MMVTLSVSYGTTVVFGSTVESFTSLSSTIVTLIQAALGEIVLDGFSDELRFCTTVSVTNSGKAAGVVWKNFTSGGPKGKS